jgi:hypothetical protein
MRFLYLFFLIFSALFADTNATDPKVASSQAGSMFLGTMGTGSAVNSNLSKPIMGGSQMKTMDGKTSFNAQIQCPSSTKAVAITFLPVGSNEYRLMVQQDSDLDGKFDYTYDTSSTGRSVSGVCSNGVIMCNPVGSWTSCQPYVWTANSNKQISLAPVDLGYSGLGSCFCSNASCGVSTLAEQIYDTIGSGISTTIMRSDSRFILSKNEYDPANMAYYLFGQNKVNCSGLGASAWDQHGEQNPTHYFDAQTPPNTSIGDIALEQGSDPNSYYSMIGNQSNVAYNKEGDTLGMPNKTSCTLTNSLKSTTTTSYDCQGSAVDWNGGSYCELAASANGHVVGNQMVSINNLNVEVKVGQSLFAQRDYSSDACDDDRATASLSYSGDVSGGYLESCGASKASKAIQIVGNSTKVTNVFINYFKEQHSGRGWDNYSIHIYKTNAYQSETFSNVVTNTCPSDCNLLDEQVCDQNGQNCIYTVKGGIKTGITPNHGCYQYNSNITTATVCSASSNITIQTSQGTQILYSGSTPYFFYKRAYDCGTSTVKIDASKQIQASGTATKTDNTSATMTYTDMNGTTQTITALPTAESCLAQSCMVKRPKVSNDVFYDKTNRSQLTGGSTVYETVTKTCTGSGPSAICPVDSSLSETMLDGCSCTGTNMRGFQQAVTNIGVVSEASKDMICSQN